MNIEIERFRQRQIEDKPILTSAKINAYLDNKLNLEERNFVEDAIGSCDKSLELFQIKKAEREFVKELIPYERISKDQLRTIKLEFKDINNAILFNEKPSLVKKIYKFLTSPVIEF